MAALLLAIIALMINKTIIKMRSPIDHNQQFVVKTVEINRVPIEILNRLSFRSDCLNSKERQRHANIYGKEAGILGFAKYRLRRPMPSITAGAKPSTPHGG